MKTEQEIRDKLYEYLWYCHNIIETEEVKVVIETLEWVLGKED